MRLLLGDCREVLRTLPDASVDSVVTDPPYELGFMGQVWDGTGVAYDVALWREVLRVLKPGGHLLAFGGARTYHRLACAVEDAGFEIRDQIMWVYGSGFPKSLDVSKAIDREAGAMREVIGVREDFLAKKQKSSASVGPGWSRPWMDDPVAVRAKAEITAPATDAARQWQGWGTALKPAHEPIVVARKPLIGTVAENVLAFGCGAINVDGCRVECEPIKTSRNTALGRMNDDAWKSQGGMSFENHPQGRWPANLIHDGSAEVVERFPASNGGHWTHNRQAKSGASWNHGSADGEDLGRKIDDTGSAARFFYTAKADATDRDQGCEGFDLRQGVKQFNEGMEGQARSDNTVIKPARLLRNHHPTVKPTDLMRYLCRLVTPRGGVVLDPFMGSGSTGKAAALEQCEFIGIELDPDYLEIARARIAWLGTAPAVEGVSDAPKFEPARGTQMALSFA